VAEDNPFVLNGLKNLIRIQEDLQLVGDAADGIAALQSIRARKPDVAVLDLSMPYLSGLGVTRLLSQTLTSVRFLAITQHDDADSVREGLEAGLRGYLLKGSAAAKLNEAIHCVFDSKIYIDPTVARRNRNGCSIRMIDKEAHYAKR
jgi:DNA-binding NarL/FixJ family response regulator